MHTSPLRTGHAAFALAISAMLGSNAHAALLTFSCPVNPPSGTSAEVLIVTKAGWTADRDALLDSYRHNAWFNPAPARPGLWVSPPMGTNTSAPFTYTSGDQVNVDAAVVDPASVSVQANVAVDNVLTDFKLQGPNTLVLPVGAANFAALTTWPSANPGLTAGGAYNVAFTLHNGNGQGSEPSQTTGQPMGLYAEVKFTATCLQTPPVPVDDTYPMTPGQTSLSDNVGGNDTLPGTPEWSLLTPPPANTGNLVFNPDGSFTFTPAPGFSGPVDFSYQLCSGPNATAPCAPAKVHITVPPAPVAPAPVNDSFSVTPGQALSASVTGNDQNVPATPEWSLVTPPPAADGTLVFNPDGTFTFTPAIGFTGPTTFTYQLCSGPGQTAPCAPATVTLSPAGSVAPVPGLGGWALLGLTAMLAGLGVRRKRAI